ncbi:MAG: hypothetical protein K5769_00145 [Pseudobutyrivibrio sp.]|nr:hypothetical protein [Pseudobutyrivibrio sp.]
MGRNKKNHEAYWRSQIQASNVLNAHLYNIGNIANSTNNRSPQYLCIKYNDIQNIIQRELNFFDYISDHLGLCMYAKDRITNKKKLTVLTDTEKDLAALRKYLFIDIENNLKILNNVGNEINRLATTQDKQKYQQIYLGIINNLNNITSSVNKLNTKAYKLPNEIFNKNYPQKDIHRLKRVKYCVNAFCKNKQLDTDKKNLEYILKLENNDTELDRLYNQLGGRTVDLLLASNEACSNYMKLINTKIQLPNYHNIEGQNRYYEEELMSHSAVVEKNNEIIRSIINAGKITQEDIYHIDFARNTILKTTEKCGKLTNLINDSTYNASNLSRHIELPNSVHDNRSLQHEGRDPQIRQGQPRQGQFA